MKTIVFTNARDEDHILEWIAHYLNLGFTTVYITDHKSSTSIQSQMQSHPQVIVNRLDIDMEFMKITLMTDALHYAKDHQYDWMIYVDADEFLYLKDASTISDFLSLYENYDCIGINWLLFGNNGHIHEPESKTLIELYTRCSKNTHELVKSFIRPQKATTPFNPHCYRGPLPHKMVSATRKLLDRKEPWFFYDTLPFAQLPAFIAHYQYQCYDCYLKRKINIPRDDNGLYRTNSIPIETFHTLFNDVENVLLMKKYNEKNKQIIEMLGSK